MMGSSSMAGDIEIPKNMKLIEQADQLSFEYNWLKPKYYIAIVAAPLFSFFLIKSDFIQGSFSQLTIPVGILMAFALVVMYYSLVKLANTTKIHVTHEELNVQHGPLPFRRNLHLKKKDFNQLYVTQHRIGDRYTLYSTTYQINVILESNEVITLVKDLHTIEQGRFIEHKIEDFLGITDIRVEGEISKD